MSFPSQIDMRASLDRIIELENEEMWENRREPTIDEGLYSSHIDMDIWTVRQSVQMQILRLKWEVPVFPCVLTDF